MSTRKKAKPSPAPGAPQMITISPSEVKNADSVPPVYSNNIQIQGAATMFGCCSM